MNTRAFREIPSQFSDKPRDTDSSTMKIQVVCTFLTLWKSPPPPFPNPGYAPALAPSFLTADPRDRLLQTHRRVSGVHA